jgi:DNA-binding transcriptional ArsR family regulator
MLPMLEPPPGRTFRPYGPASDAAVVTTPFAITSPWTPYGLSDDPFFQEPLDPTDDTSRPVSLFVGRRAELQLVAGQIVGNKHASRALVQGAPGVGKTSFVSALKYGLARQQDAPVLMHRLPVRIQAGMNPRQFTAAVLQVLLQMRGTLVAQAPAPARAGRAAKRAVGAGDEAFWTRVARVVAGEDSLAGGVSTPLFGAQQERVRIAPEVQDLPLDADVAEAVARLAAPEDGGPRRRVLLHVNNLERLTREGAAAAAGLLEDVRDLFFTEHAHWLFVGAAGIDQAVFQRTAQVGGVLTLTTTLQPLAAGVIAEMLAKRYAHLRTGLRFTAPVPLETAAALYDRYHGDLRRFLSLLSQAVQRHAVTHPGRPADAAAVVALMAPARREALAERLGEPATRALEQVVGGRPVGTTFRVAEVQQATGLTQSAASELVQRLLAREAITLVERRGNSVFYRVAAGDDTVALRMIDPA